MRDGANCNAGFIAYFLFCERSGELVFLQEWMKAD
jgi:hypothetical protein